MTFGLNVISNEYLIFNFWLLSTIHMIILSVGRRYYGSGTSVFGLTSNTSTLVWKCIYTNPIIIAITIHNNCQGRWNRFCLGGARIIRKMTFCEFSKILLSKCSILGGARAPPAPPVPPPLIIMKDKCCKTMGIIISNIDDI